MPVKKTPRKAIAAEKKALSSLAKAVADLKALERRRPGMGIKVNHAHPAGYYRGIQSTIGALKALRKRKRRV